MRRHTHRIALLTLGTWLLSPMAASAQSTEATATGPSPIHIDRHGGPPTIPHVDSDKVIGFALYTVQDRVLKLSAQLYPLKPDESRTVTLEIRRDGQWRQVARADADELGWLAAFRVTGWDHSRDWDYRVTHPGGAEYTGRIRRDPADKDEIVVAAFTGNSNSDRSLREDISRNIKALDPDLLFFSGDQSYDHRDHTAAWLMFGRQFGDIIRDRPTITIPDDHDVGQGNIWGEAGGVARIPGASDGGYAMPAAYVNMVQRAQTAHLPDPYDPTPVRQGITVYYTALNVGGVSFAIIEDRKFKSGPAGLLPPMGPRPDHITDPTYDRAAIDVPEAQLLGKRQLAFLRDWGQDWRDAEMKAVLSQTIFGGGAHLHGSHDNRLLADLDSNGWPQSGRARALQEMRRCFALHIAGDQHLATVINHGINEWEDANVSFCVPSIVNYYGRWWWPLEEPLNHDPASVLPFTGRYYDGFGNKLTMRAYANPTESNHNAAGFGIVRFRLPSREMVIECWPRQKDVTDPATKQHPGWPITVGQMENYGRHPLAWLPTLKIAGQDKPVVQVVDEELDEIVYTLRLPGNTFDPPVFKEGTYFIRIGEGATMRTLIGVPTGAERGWRTIEVGG